MFNFINLIFCFKLFLTNITMLLFKWLIVLIFLTNEFVASSQSIARQWNEILLEAISNDFARPTVHARNLYHVSAMSYDIWAAYEGRNDFHFLGKTIKGYTIPFDGVKFVNDKLSAQEEAISFASYRLLLHRFQNSPGIGFTSGLMNNLMQLKGYDILNTSTDFVTGGPAEFGNWVAEQVIAYGLQDGSNEANNYANIFYEPKNPPIEMELPGNPNIIDPNHWQAIELSIAFDQAGNPVLGPQDHLSPEWGNVNTFAMDDSLSVERVDANGNQYRVFNDPGDPAWIDLDNAECLSSLYKWNHMMVSIWQSHNTPLDGVVWDISPGAIGNVSTDYPTDINNHHQFYNYFEGGHADEPGHAINPHTGLPYEPNLVNRGDYVRVIAEYWADGLNSETPPGHWFKILNDVIDQPMFEKRWMGVGPVLADLEFDVLSYFTLGGMMHDAAISAWSIKGWYDYVRPSSALRWMGDIGQCSDPNDLSYNPNGMPIITGYSELVYPGDPLAGPNNENVGKMKLYTWRGHDYVINPDTDIAGVGWILSEDWWPYQLPTFVTPPFAGYISGHSTFSATAANVLSLITGSPFFPGGMMEYEFVANEFLEFELGPHNTVKLQWATYKDASDQCSLSRIWGGIHPPVDDIPGRIIGDKIGPIGVQFANDIIQKEVPGIIDVLISKDSISQNDWNDVVTFNFVYDKSMDTSFLPELTFIYQSPIENNVFQLESLSWLDSTIFEAAFIVLPSVQILDSIIFTIDSAKSGNGIMQKKSIFDKMVWVNTRKPSITKVTPSVSLINTENSIDGFELYLKLNKPCDTQQLPFFEIVHPSTLNNSIVINEVNSNWITSDSLILLFDIDLNDDIETLITFQISDIVDPFGNELDTYTATEVFQIDTKSPNILNANINKTVFNRNDFGPNNVEITLQFDKVMDTTNLSPLIFSFSNLANQPLVFNALNSSWISSTSCNYKFHLPQNDVEFLDIDIFFLTNIKDTSGNFCADTLSAFFSIDTERPSILNLEMTNSPIYDGNAGLGNWSLWINYSEKMDENSIPFVEISHPEGINNSLQYRPNDSYWLNDSIFEANFLIEDQNIERDSLDLLVYFAKDISGNEQVLTDIKKSEIGLDTRNPKVSSFTANTFLVNNQIMDYQNIIVFDESMDTSTMPTLLFNENEFLSVLTWNSSQSEWLTSMLYKNYYDVELMDYHIEDVDLFLYNAFDQAGNQVEMDTLKNYLTIDIQSLDVSEIDNFEKFLVFPNPINQGDYLFIKSPENWCSAINLLVVDSQGRVVDNPSFNFYNDNTLRIKADQYSTGLYQLQISCYGNVKVFKFTIQ